MVYFQMTQKCNSVINCIFYYQVPPAFTTPNNMFVYRCHQYMYKSNVIFSCSMPKNPIDKELGLMRWLPKLSTGQDIHETETSNTLKHWQIRMYWVCNDLSPKLLNKYVQKSKTCNTDCKYVEIKILNRDLYGSPLFGKMGYN